MFATTSVAWVDLVESRQDLSAGFRMNETDMWIGTTPNRKIDELQNEKYGPQLSLLHHFSIHHAVNVAFSYELAIPLRPPHEL